MEKCILEKSIRFFINFATLKNRTITEYIELN